MNKKNDTADIQKLLITNDSLFNHLHVINQEFDILPNKDHFGMSINYVDLQDTRLDFIREMINTIVDWVYSKSKQSKVLVQFDEEGRTKANSYSELMNSARMKFRPSGDGQLLHGQFGELLLSNCIQRFMGAVPILRKMPITTSSQHERYGADAIHYNWVAGEHLMYLGEAKSYTSRYKFNSAFEDAVRSILNTYDNIRNELRLYIHEDFLEPSLQSIATGFLNSTLKNVKINLVSIVSYNETKKIVGDSEAEIKSSIEKIICDRYKGFDKSKISIDKNKILNRITYIVFPIWDFENLLDEFAQYI